MLFLNDVWVNWFEGEATGYNVCHFHEWKKEDPLELLEQVPVLKVRTALFEQIENQMQDLPENLLKAVRNQCLIRKNNERVKVEYCFIVSDGMSILAVDTAGYRFPLRKSRLIPRQETVIYEMLEGEKEHILAPFFYPKYEMEFSLQNPHPKYMVGLTRDERIKKQLLFMALDNLCMSQDISQLKYWYTEWEPSVYNRWKNAEFKQIWTDFFMSIAKGWSQRHEQITEQMIKGMKGFAEQLASEKSFR